MLALVVYSISIGHPIMYYATSYSFLWLLTITVILLTDHEVIFVSSFSTPSSGNTGLTSSISDSSSNDNNPKSREIQFPTKGNSPNEVLIAQLEALHQKDMDATFNLFSRARRGLLEDVTRRSPREYKVDRERLYKIARKFLDQCCPSLVGHKSSRILSIVGDPNPQPGRLHNRICRVQVDSKYFIFVLTRQSAYDGGDPRDNDGFGQCWFVWSITPEEGGIRKKSKKPSIPTGGGGKRRVLTPV